MDDPFLDVFLWGGAASLIGVAGLVFVDKWRLREQARICRARQREDQFEGTAEDQFEGTDEGNSLFQRLVPAPWWASLYSLGLYLYLASAGMAHMARAVMGTPNRDRLKGDIALLCVLYLAESTAAVVFGCSTMRNWRLWDFVVHHVPFGVTAVLPSRQESIYSAFSTTHCLWTS